MSDVLAQLVKAVLVAVGLIAVLILAAAIDRWLMVAVLGVILALLLIYGLTRFVVWAARR